MQGRLITIFGGTGFLGSYLIPKLIATGACVRVAVRNMDAADSLKICGQVGLLEIVPADFKDEDSLASLVGDSDYVINLIGILAASRKNSFEEVHTQIPKRIAQACQKQGVKKFIHVSSIGADPDSPSQYLSSKGKAEQEIFKITPSATILRPSVLFGAEDDFFNRFANMSLFSPFLPLIAGGNIKLQPTYVGDVADAILKILADQKVDLDPHAGKIYELGGPEVYTFKKIMTYIFQETGRKRLLVSLPTPIAMLLGAILQIFPSPVLTREQVRLATIDNFVSPKALTFQDLGITPKSIPSLVPAYLSRYKKHC